MIELHPSVLEELDKLEQRPETAWDSDLLLFREYMEQSLSVRGAHNRILMRIFNDHEFFGLVFPAMIESIHVEADKTKRQNAEFDRRTRASHYWIRRQRLKPSRRRRIARVVVLRRTPTWLGPIVNVVTRV